MLRLILKNEKAYADFVAEGLLVRIRTAIRLTRKEAKQFGQTADDELREWTRYTLRVCRAAENGGPLPAEARRPFQVFQSGEILI